MDKLEMMVDAKQLIIMEKQLKNYVAKYIVDGYSVKNYSIEEMLNVVKCAIADKELNIKDDV